MWVAVTHMSGMKLLLTDDIHLWPNLIVFVAEESKLSQKWRECTIFPPRPFFPAGTETALRPAFDCWLVCRISAVGWKYKQAIQSIEILIYWEEFLCQT